MERFRAQDAWNPALHIQQFLEATPNVERPPDNRSLIARLSSLNIHILRQITRGLSKQDDFPRDVLISLERSYGRFKLWSDGYDILNGNLDESFEKSRNLRHATLRLLRRLSNTISERLIPQLGAHLDWKTEALIDDISHIRLLNESASGDHSEDSSSDTSSVFEDDTLDEITEDLMNETMCLADLAPLIESPVFDSDTERSGPESAGNLTQWIPHQLYSNMVQSRFPSADDALVVRLGKANYERYLRCQEQRARREAQELEVQLPMEGTVAGSKFHDSAIGSSFPAASAYAETVMSYKGENEHHARIPPLPKEGKEGKPFTCTACGDIVLITNNSAWKRHLFQDLCPWLCLDETCASGNKVYTTREDWVLHLALDHTMEPGWNRIKCSLCHEVVGPGKMLVTKHLGAHLEEISLRALPTSVEFEDEMEDTFEHTQKVANLPQSLPEAIPLQEEQLRKVDTISRVEPLASSGRIPGLDNARKNQDVAGDLADGFSSEDEEDWKRKEMARTSYKHPDASSSMDPINNELTEPAYGGTHKLYEQQPHTEMEENGRRPAFSYPGYMDATSAVSAPPARGMSLPMTPGQMGAPEAPSSKKHKCPYCDAEFTRHHNLKGHLLTHSHDKPYACQTCQMRFRRLHDLKRHSKLHTGEKPHICPKCKRKFARGDALARHNTGGCVSRRGSLFGDDDFQDSSQLEGGVDSAAESQLPDLKYQDMQSDGVPMADTSQPSMDADEQRKDPRSSAPQQNVDVPNPPPDADEDDEDDVDANEPRYCYCNGVSRGTMVGCDGDDCEKEWFHLECTGLKLVPSSTAKWYCDDCKDGIKNGKKVT